MNAETKEKYLRNLTCGSSGLWEDVYLGGFGHGGWCELHLCVAGVSDSSTPSLSLFRMENLRADGRERGNIAGIFRGIGGLLFECQGVGGGIFGSVFGAKKMKSPDSSRIGRFHRLVRPLIHKSPHSGGI